MPRFFFSNYKDSDIYSGKPAQMLKFLIFILNMSCSNLGRDADRADWEVSLRASRSISIWYLKSGKDRFLRHLPD